MFLVSWPMFISGFFRPEMFVFSCLMADVYFMFFPACDVCNFLPHGRCLFSCFSRPEIFVISCHMADVYFMFCPASDPL